MERKIDRDVIRAALDQAGRPARVVALNQRMLAPPAEMVLLSLEEWTTSFTVHWFFATSDPSDAIDLRLQTGLEWDLIDDRGNQYRGGDYGGGGGNSPNWRRSSYFAPALDSEATRLAVRVTSPVTGTSIEAAVGLARCRRVFARSRAVSTPMEQANPCRARAGCEVAWARQYRMG